MWALRGRGGINVTGRDHVSEITTIVTVITMMMILGLCEYNVQYQPRYKAMGDCGTRYDITLPPGLVSVTMHDRMGIGKR